VDITKPLNKITDKAGDISAILIVFLAIFIVYDIGMRYLFNSGSIAIQELQWHIFDIAFLLGISYTLKQNGHVRVDIFYEKYLDNTKLSMQILSMLLLVIPSSILIGVGGFEMAMQSFAQGEISSDPGGLEYRFIIKSFISIAFILVILQAISITIKAFAKLQSKDILLKALIVIISIGILAILDLPYIIEPVGIMFVVSLGMLMAGFEVAFVFAGIGILFAGLTDDIGLGIFNILSYRIFGIMQNVTLMAVPLFIFMGLILERSKMAEELLLSVAKLFGRVRGGLAIAVVLVGALLGASTGIVGATVVMMSLIALPLMLKNRYSPSLSSGVIASSGTLGQIIPPSVVLIILGDQMHLSVGELFQASIVPAMILISLFIIYILTISFINKDIAPAIEDDSNLSIRELLTAIVPPLGLMIVVLGSIFAGVATPTESAGLGVVGALIISYFKGGLSFESIKSSSLESVKLTAMIFMILIGATIFSLVFNELGGGDIVLDFFSKDIGDKATFIILSMLAIFILGFFIDFIEIAFVVVPILLPIVNTLGIDPIWFAVLIALNLQASFLTPPFGFALFYLKGSAKDMVKTRDIYKGVIPFIGLQILALIIIIIFPDLIYIFN